jgi:transcriptional regulator with XRE-family HTH domain
VLLGARIRKLRESAALSQEELGRPYLSRAGVSRVESGKGTNLKTLIHFAHRLRLRVRDLIPPEI